MEQGLSILFPVIGKLEVYLGIKRVACIAVVVLAHHTLLGPVLASSAFALHAHRKCLIIQRISTASHSSKVICILVLYTLGFAAHKGL